MLHLRNEITGTKDCQGCVVTQLWSGDESIDALFKCQVRNADTTCISINPLKQRRSIACGFCGSLQPSSKTFLKKINSCSGFPSTLLGSIAHKARFTPGRILPCTPRMIATQKGPRTCKRGRSHQCGRSHTSPVQDQDPFFCTVAYSSSLKRRVGACG